jgi:serine/threonine protein kinase
VTASPGHQAETLWEDGEFVLSRGVWDGEPLPLLAVRPSSPQPSPETLARLQRAHALREELDPAWAARPLRLEPRQGRLTLVSEDPGGEPLLRLMGRPWEIRAFLHVAIGIATALAQVHQRGLIHKDIKPANVLVDSVTGHAWLTGFGIASRLPRERQSPAPPEVIAGTLAYMAPEQTGRMNRSIDARSDLYALGITLYEMLTGELPFAASDPMEWVHCHIARQPAPPDERVAGIPGPLSAIVMKLLAKNAEDRYQTAAGLAVDLRKCLTEWERNRGMPPFPLGADDVPDRLLIPEKLYGREHEIGTLLGAFDRVVANGATELVLVSGYAGIGKSSVVNELHKALVPPRGLFASGKFDQYKRDIPYATLAQAFGSLVRPLLGESETNQVTSTKSRRLRAPATNLKRPMRASCKRGPNCPRRPTGAIPQPSPASSLNVIHQRQLAAGGERAHFGEGATIEHARDRVARGDHDQPDRAGFEVAAIVAGSIRRDRSAGDRS